jgi:hypothetical protein
MMIGKAALSFLGLVLCRLISVTPFLLLLGCDDSVSRTPRNSPAATVKASKIPGLIPPEHYPLLVYRLNQLAGHGAIDCGMAEVGESPDIASDCALKAWGERKPFIVRYDVQGIDTEQALGFAGTESGNVSGLWFFGAGYATGGHPTDEARSRKLRFTDDGRISIEECSSPINFRKSSNGRVTCFLRDP